jgi:hypothetical protein
MRVVEKKKMHLRNAICASLDTDQEEGGKEEFPLISISCLIQQETSTSTGWHF